MKKLILAFATMLFSVATFSQNLSANVRSTTLPDGTIVVTYTNKTDKHFIRSNDGINYTIETQGRSRIILASITPDESGNKNVVIGSDIKFSVNSSGNVKLNLTDNYSSVTGTNSCIGDYQAKCRQEWACTIICAAGFSPGCILGWAMGCAVEAMSYIGEIVSNKSLTSSISMAQEECRKDWERATGVLE